MPRERRGSNKSKERVDGEGKQTGNRNRPSASPAPRTPASPSRAKRRAVQCSQSLPELIPPLLGGPGDNIVAHNPFDDPRQHQLAPLQSQGGYPGPHHHPLGPPGPAGAYGMHPKHGPPMPPVSMPPGVGKVYPPNQPMVFNPSNPNAPPIYPCGICHKEVHDNDQAILCESGCNFWFHRVCTGLTEAAYQMLTQEVYAEWVCDKCLQTKNIPLVKMKP